MEDTSKKKKSQYAVTMDPVAFFEERSRTQAGYNKQLENIKKKIKAEAELNGSKDLYSFPLEDSVFGSAVARKKNSGARKITKVDVHYYETLHDNKRGDNGILVHFISRAGTGIEIMGKELAFNDEEKSVSWWKSGVFFTTPGTYFECKRILTEIYEELNIPLKEPRVEAFAY